MPNRERVVMDEQEFNRRALARFESQGDDDLSPERMLGRLEGMQIKVEQDLYRISNMSLVRTLEILERELGELDMLIKFQKGEMKP